MRLKQALTAILFAALLGAGLAQAHFNWIRPLAPTLAAGQAVMVEIGTGHRFPASEAAMRGETKAFVITPSGKRAPLAVSERGKALAASYDAVEAGLHRFYFENDRGLLSRTTKGYLSGGRDQHPKAIESSRVYRSGVAYLGTEGSQSGTGEAAGLPFEMTGRVDGAALLLTVLKEGKPCPGARIHFGTPASHHEQEAGSTGADGTFRYPLSGHHGKILFVAEYAEKGPAGSNYDQATYEAALYLELP